MINIGCYFINEYFSDYEIDTFIVEKAYNTEKCKKEK